MFNSATYSQLRVNGSQLRDEMADQLSSVYQEAILAVRTLVSSTEQLFDRECANTDDKQYADLGRMVFAYSNIALLTVIFSPQASI